MVKLIGSPRKLLFFIWGSVLALQFATWAKAAPEKNSEELYKKHEKELEELKKLAKEGGHPDPDSITKFDEDTCYTHECLESAKEFLFSVNFKEDPCKKGSWLKYVCVRRTLSTEENEELNDMHQQGQVGYLGTVALGQTLALLEAKNHPSGIMKKASTYYEQCEDWKHSDNETQIDQIRTYLEYFGEWPLLTGKNSPGDNFDWQKFMANTVRIAVAYGVAPYLFDTFLEEDGVPLLFTGELSLHKDDSEIIEIIKLLNEKREISEKDPQIQEMRDFMAKLTHPTEDQIHSYKIKNITDHHDFGENFDLAKFYAKMLAGTKIEITPDSTVAADVEWLVQHVKAINEADPRVIANILFLQTAAALLTRLTTMTHGQHLPTLQKYRRTGPLDCLQETHEKFDYAMSSEFIHRYYDHDGTPALVQLVEDLKVGYAETIDHAEFLTSKTKVHAIDKTKDIHTFIATDAWVMDDEKLMEYYKNMDISKDKNFVHNHVAGLGFQWIQFLELTNANIFSYLVGDAYTGYVSSKYSYHFNQLRIQAALVQKPLFNPKYPGFMNYGGIGTVLAHSLGHSFDTNGVHFNKKGQRGDFWDDMSYEGYYNWTDSLIEDYSNDDYKRQDPWDSSTHADIDHAQAVNDDIADIVGVHMAYRAYQKYLMDLEKDGKKELVLPGLKEFTGDKLFWMKYANIWCEHTDKSYLHALRDFSQHSPGNVRATHPVSRSKEWADNFGCKAPAKTDF